VARVDSYRDLLVWQRAMDIAVAVYELTRTYPRDETFGLTAQTRRAAASVPANIAEGFGRASRASYAHFAKIAQGSLKELETHLILAERVGATKPGTTDAILRESDELGRMLRSLITKLA
jgi:four helix bundle protein